MRYSSRCYISVLFAFLSQGLKVLSELTPGKNKKPGIYYEALVVALHEIDFEHGGRKTAVGT